MSEDIKTKSISMPFNSNADINVTYGDLFENKKGYIVITVDEFIETDLKYLERTDSLHGIFLEKFFKDKSTELEELVNKDLMRQKLPAKDPRRGFLEPYPMGTTVLIEKGGYKFLLLVFHTQYGVAPYIDFSKSLFGLLKVINTCAFNRPVYLPVLGSEFARLELSKPERSLEEAIIIQMILNIIYFYCKTIDRDRELMSDINIIVHEKTKIPVDLSLIAKTFGQLKLTNN